MGAAWQATTGGAPPGYAALPGRRRVGRAQRAEVAALWASRSATTSGERGRCSGDACGAEPASRTGGVGTEPSYGAGVPEGAAAAGAVLRRCTPQAAEGAERRAFFLGAVAAVLFFFLFFFF
jgi:hypothetical protein